MSRKNGNEQTLLHVLYKARQDALHGSAPPDDDFRVQNPLLWDVLTHVWLSQTTRVAPGSVTIQPIGGDWLWRLRAPSLSATCSVNVSTWAQGVPALERLLEQGPKVWTFSLRGKVKKQVFKDLENDDLDNL
jgi:hypothetical protein